MKKVGRKTAQIRQLLRALSSYRNWGAGLRGAVFLFSAAMLLFFPFAAAGWFRPLCLLVLALIGWVGFSGLEKPWAKTAAAAATILLLFGCLRADADTINSCGCLLLLGLFALIELGAALGKSADSASLSRPLRLTALALGVFAALAVLLMTVRLWASSENDLWSQLPGLITALLAAGLATLANVKISLDFGRMK